ncbi:uncharacterized protein LDX57_008173 [Aspergillus melleus]|uniref:uncharacterized protein n=1 Tax=Aspergillus melleus TaxID=138277 RepID=UPI001E8D9F25|nr:uncharacterized protein LDX57_008173 [Aspergillus melleus]KAH8430511.1 hypothetical protein LDX57_008173 [Aspergillus melleus]
MVNHELWEKAVQQLDKRDQQKIRPGERQLVSLESVLLGAQKKQKECKDKQLKYRKRDGTEVELRQVFGRVVQRLVKFKAIGDSVAAVDSAHLAVPWAAISLVLQIAVSDIESYQTVFEGIEAFSSLVPRYALFENLYLRAIFPLQDDLKSALVKLYVMVLQYLLRAEEYCATRTIKRIAKGLILAYSEFDGWMDEIREQQRIADELARLIDVQVSRQADDKLDLMKSEQDALMEGLQYFHQPIQSIRDDVSDLANSWKKRERDEQEGRILSWLSPLPLVKLHRERLVPNSGRWIFEEESYIQWRVSSKSSALWLHGLRKIYIGRITRNQE